VKGEIKKLKSFRLVLIIGLNWAMLLRLSLRIKVFTYQKLMERMFRKVVALTKVLTANLSPVSR